MAGDELPPPRSGADRVEASCKSAVLLTAEGPCDKGGVGEEDGSAESAWRLCAWCCWVARQGREALHDQHQLSW